MRVHIAYCVLRIEAMEERRVGTVAYCVLRIVLRKVMEERPVGTVAYCVLRIACCVCVSRIRSVGDSACRVLLRVIMGP